MPINSQIAYLMWLWTHWPSGSVTNLSGPWLMWWIPNKNDWLSRMAPSVSRHWNVLCLCLIAPNTDILLHLYSYRHLFTDTCLPTPVLIQMICLVRYSIFSRGFKMHLHLRLIPPIMKIWERNAKVSPDVETFTAVLGESECVHRNCQIKCLDNVHKFCQKGYIRHPLVWLFHILSHSACTLAGQVCIYCLLLRWIY